MYKLPKLHRQAYDVAMATALDQLRSVVVQLYVLNQSAPDGEPVERYSSLIEESVEVHKKLHELYGQNLANSNAGEHHGH